MRMRLHAIIVCPQTISGNHDYIDTFIASETDFVQTDYCEYVAAYLRNEGLR